METGTTMGAGAAAAAADAPGGWGHVPAAPGLLLPAVSLAKRELVRFLRQRNRVIGALATPIVFWMLVGGGMGRSFRASGLPDGENYLQYFFPGTILMILLFTAIFSTISIIEERREGFLQSVLVAPVSRMAIVLGKVLGGTVLAFAQAAVFLLLGPLVGVRPNLAGLLLALGLMALLAFALTALGFCIAWRMSSTQGFHAVMNLFLMPMWFLSGALFPAHNASGPLRAIMLLNPLTYGLAGVRQALYLGKVPSPGAAGEIAVAYAAMAGFALLLIFLASTMARGRVAGDLQ
jgi:ABC-2 type transport system permease protein